MLGPLEAELSSSTGEPDWEVLSAASQGDVGITEEQAAAVAAPSEAAVGDDIGGTHEGEEVAVAALPVSVTDTTVPPPLVNVLTVPAVSGRTGSRTGWPSPVSSHSEGDAVGLSQLVVELQADVISNSAVPAPSEAADNSMPDSGAGTAPSQLAALHTGSTAVPARTSLDAPLTPPPQRVVGLLARLGFGGGPSTAAEALGDALPAAALLLPPPLPLEAGSEQGLSDTGASAGGYLAGSEVEEAAAGVSEEERTAPAAFDLPAGEEFGGQEPPGLPLGADGMRSDFPPPLGAGFGAEANVGAAVDVGAELPVIADFPHPESPLSAGALLGSSGASTPHSGCDSVTAGEHVGSGGGHSVYCSNDEMMEVVAVASQRQLQHAVRALEARAAHQERELALAKARLASTQEALGRECREVSKLRRIATIACSVCAFMGLALLGSPPPSTHSTSQATASAAENTPAAQVRPMKEPVREVDAFSSLPPPAHIVHVYGPLQMPGALQVALQGNYTMTVVEVEPMAAE